MADDGLMSYFAKIGLDASEFLNGIARSREGWLGFYRDVTISIGATMLIFDKFLQYGQKFIELSNQAAEYVGTIDKLAITTGMSTEELQRWTNVARYADSDITTLAMSVNKMQMNLAAQGESGERARQMLDDMGVSYRNIDGSLKSSAELFPLVIQGLKGLESSADRVTAANTIFGRSYQSLAGYMEMSQSEMETYFSEAGTLTEEQTQALRDYEDATKDMNASLQNLSNTAGSELAPAFREFTDMMNGMADNEGIMAFFSTLNDFLTLIARGFHIMGSEATSTWQVMNLDFSGAMETKQDLSKWISQKTRDDAMRAAGYRTDGMGNVIAEEEKPKGSRLSFTETEEPETAAAKKVMENEIVLQGIDNLIEGKMTLDDLRSAVDRGTISWQQYNDILGGLETSMIEEHADAVEGLTDKLSGMQDKMDGLQRGYARDLQMLDPRDVQGFINLKMRNEWDIEDQQGRINAATAGINTLQSASSFAQPVAAQASTALPGITITGPITVNGDKSFEKMLEEQRVRAGVRLR